MNSLRLPRSKSKGRNRSQRAKLKQLFLFTLALSFASFCSFGATTTSFATKPSPEHQVTICHATASDSNPYVSNTVDVASIVTQGHDSHTQGGRADIIPPFNIGGYSYGGRSWDAAGQAIYYNGCNPPAPPVDECPNIEGAQATVPAGMIKDNSGNCVTPPPPVDVCPNIDGAQSEVPQGMIKNTDGNCVEPPVDVCPNLEGDQSEVPDGMEKDNEGNCVTPPPPPTDVCPNIAGTQTAVPAGMVVDSSGNCVEPTTPPAPVVTPTPPAEPVQQIEIPVEEVEPPKKAVAGASEAPRRTVAAGGRGELPYTGLETPLMGGLGALFLGAGFGFRRFGRRKVKK